MDKRNKLSARCATSDKMLTKDNIAGIRGEVLMDDRIRGHCQIEELLYEVHILSDSPVVQSDCEVSYCQIQGLRSSDCVVVIVSSK